MRALISLAAVASALAPAAAMAATDTDSKEVGITGSVSALCVLGEPTTDLVDLDELANTSGANVGRLRSVAKQTVTLPNSFCNFANSAVTVEATALKADDKSTPPTGFARAINFVATAKGWSSSGDATATTTDDGAGRSGAVQGTGATQTTPKLSDITLELTNFDVPSNKLLVFGDYNTTVTVTLAPAISD